MGQITIEIVLAGSGERARAWLDTIQRSARLRLVACVGRNEAPVNDVPHYGSLSAAMAAHPAAAFAVALPPRAGLAAALSLAEAGRSAVVEAPLHPALRNAPLAGGADAVRVAHGWTTLPGARALRLIAAQLKAPLIDIDIAGLPESDQGDLTEVLVHGLALARTLAPSAAIAEAKQTESAALEIGLIRLRSPSPATSAGEGKINIRLRLCLRGQRVAVRLSSAGREVRWTWEDGRESLIVDRKPRFTARPTPAAPARALAQLLPEANRGDSLADAAAVARLAQEVLTQLPTEIPPGARPFRQSVSIAERRPQDLLGRLGLRGELPVGAPISTPLELALPPEPLELWPFLAGIKPVVFLTVRPEDVERTLSFFGAVHCERRERRVEVQAQDRWADRRDQGEPFVELYISHEPEIARRAARLQADEDPSRASRVLGTLVGYPRCCIEAFARQDDRSNNSRNRYFSAARTRAPDAASKPTGDGPWPWELNNLFVMLVPFYPCSYRCDEALQWARASLAQMAQAHPELTADLRAALARPVLYFDHDHQLVFDGESDGMSVRYRRVWHAPETSASLAPLAAALGAGDRLVFDDAQLTVEQASKVSFKLERTDPALGFIAPFGAAHNATA